MRAAAVFAVAGSLGLCAGCAGPAHPWTGVSGLVTPCGMVRTGTVITVSVTAPDGTLVHRQRVTVNSRRPKYRIALSPGRYVVRAPASSLPSVTVPLSAGEDASVNFLPSCK